MTIKPAQNKVAGKQRLLKPTSSIVLPDKASATQAQMPYIEVTEIGPDVKTTKVGDKVLVLPANCIGFVDPSKPDSKDDVILVTSEDNIIGYYIE